MTHETDLRAAERRAFHIAVDDGLWDVLLAGVISMMAIGPSLSTRLGDFWSSAVFVPVWIVLYLIVRSIRRRWVIPRTGTVRFGAYRQQRLRRFTLLMLLINVIAFVGGLVAAIGGLSSEFPVVFLPLTILLFFSLAGYFLDTPRLYLYGLMLAAALPIGEWLFREGLASHHGFPIVFGVGATVIALTGIARFVRLLRRQPPPSDPYSG